MGDTLGLWMKIGNDLVLAHAISSVRMARHEIRWWYERFSEHELAPRFAKILDDLDELEKLCRSATSTTAQSAEANAAPAGTPATRST